MFQAILSAISKGSSLFAKLGASQSSDDGISNASLPGITSERDRSILINHDGPIDSGVSLLQAYKLLEIRKLDEQLSSHHEIGQALIVCCNFLKEQLRAKEFNFTALTSTAQEREFGMDLAIALQRSPAQERYINSLVNNIASQIKAGNLFPWTKDGASNYDMLQVVKPGTTLHQHILAQHNAINPKHEVALLLSCRGGINQGVLMLDAKKISVEDLEWFRLTGITLNDHIASMRGSATSARL